MQRTPTSGLRVRCAGYTGWRWRLLYSFLLLLLSHCFVSCNRPTYQETTRGRETPSLISTWYLGIKSRQSFHEGYSVACVPGGFFFFWAGEGVFFCGSQSNRGTNAAPRLKQKTMGEGRGRGENLLSPSPIVFFFVLGSAIARLYLLLFEPHEQKKRHTWQKYGASRASAT